MSTPAVPVNPPEKPDVVIVSEIPESLNRALLLMVKNFYSTEHFLIAYYIMMAKCIREENLRNKLHYDQKELRQKLAILKAEKLVKERLHQQKNENGRSISIIFYFINYRAIINVLMYKIDHMRQKLEAREKEDTQKAMYKCTQCAMKYETLDVDRLLDHFTGSLKCWRCQAEVITDETGGPSQVTRSLLAKFNEQLQPLFFVAQELKGIQLAPHLLEPDITKFMDKEDKDNMPQMGDAVDFTHVGDRISLGGKAFSGHKNAPTLRYAHGDQIIVDLNADSTRKEVEETRQVPLWLQDDAIVGAVENAQAIASVTDSVVVETQTAINAPTTSSTVTLEMLRQLEEDEEEPPQKKIKMEEDVSETAPAEPIIKTETNSEGDEEDEEAEEDVMVTVAGVQMPFDEVAGNEELIGQMTEEEKEEYERVWNEHYSM